MAVCEAVSIVGSAEGADYAADLHSHRIAYERTAPKLAEILGSSAVAAEASAYMFHDAQATESQTKYKKWMLRTSLSVFFTTVLGGFTMAVSLVSGDASSVDIISSRPVSASTALVAMFGAFSLYKLREGKLLETWMVDRSTAEAHRQTYFNFVFKEAEKRKEAAYLEFALEYFRRYHLDAQRAFFRERSKSHRRSAENTVTLGAGGAAIATVASLGGAVANGPWVALGALSVAGAATGALAASRELMNQDRRNSERYLRTWSALQTLSGQLDQIRLAASTGDHALVGRFAAAVNEQVFLEHRQWLEAGETARQAIERLQTKLARASEDDQEKPAAAPTA